MKHLLLVIAVVASFAAFLMAFTATSQAFGVTGKIGTSRFILGPSWRWFAFDVVGFFWDVCVTAACFHLWMKS